MRRALVLADLTGLSLSFLVVSADDGYDWRILVTSLASLPAWIVIAHLYRLYDLDEERTHHSTTDDIVGVFHVVTIGTWLIFVGLRASDIAHPSVAKAVILWSSAILAITAARTVARAVCRRSPLYVENTLIVGAGDVGQRVARKLLRHPEYGLRLVGFVDADPKPRYEDLLGQPLLGGPDRLAEIVRDRDVQRVIVAFSTESEEETLGAVRGLNDLEVQVDIVPRLYELVSPSVKIDTLEGLPVIELPPARMPRSSRALKRTLDVVCAGVALLVVSPVFALAALAVWLDSGGPVFFRQVRLGKGQREFVVLKFRTMAAGPALDVERHRTYVARTMNGETAANGNGLYKPEQEDAITRAGGFLRRTSLDELPQLLNVLRGDMSLVGPRPCIPYETEFFKPHHFDRFLVPAGITGLWQVTARSQSTFGEALDMDVAYARGWSLALDLRLLCRTPLAVLAGRGAA
jgi:exopolysaccharide biosynthesis polyprenyl glycosylphosphotransferase